MNADFLPPETKLQNGLFVVRDVLGRGGFGITYRAFDVTQQREVAIKELFTTDCRRRLDLQVELVEPARSETFQKARTRFLQQARVLSRLRHPNIVRVVSFFEENATAYLVMELLSGRNLLELVESRGALSENEARGFIEKIGGALESIHCLGLLHLDIKPENVLLTAQNRVVLMDFDLVQKLHADEELQTRPLDAPSHCGTPGYAPIEQYSIATRFSPATDMYALGATLHHLIVGTAPLSALERAHDEAVTLPDSVSENVRRSLEKSLRIRVEERPQSVRAFLDILNPPLAVPVAIPAAPNVVANPTAPIPTTASPTNSSQNTPTSNRDLVWRVRVDTSSTRSPKWPDFCPCCAAAAVQLYEIRRGVRRWNVPHCEWCAQHLDSARTAVFVGAWGMLGGLLVAALGFDWGNLFLGPIGLGIHLWGMGYGILKTYSAETMKKPGCLDKNASLRVRSQGFNFVVWEFRSRDYADAFRQLNNAVWG